MNYTQVEFTLIHPEQSDVLMALLTQIGFESFEEKYPLLLAFIVEKDFSESAVKSIIENHAFLSGIQYTTESIAPTNWNAVWESNFQPILLNQHWSVRAGFHEPLHTTHEIVINPKMSFGTGHHATTKMMMLLMEKINFKDKSVFDYGAGTGILSIMAAKLGARPIFSIDHEEWAFRNATENYQTNGCAYVENHCGSIELVKDKKFDIILANINKNVLLESAQALKESSYSDTILLLSGILEEDQRDILSTFNALNFKEIEIVADSPWCAIKLIQS